MLWAARLPVKAISVSVSPVFTLVYITWSLIMMLRFQGKVSCLLIFLKFLLVYSDQTRTYFTLHPTMWRLFLWLPHYIQLIVDNGTTLNVVMNSHHPLNLFFYVVYRIYCYVMAPINNPGNPEKMLTCDWRFNQNWNNYRGIKITRGGHKVFENFNQIKSLRGWVRDSKKSRHLIWGSSETNPRRSGNVS